MTVQAYRYHELTGGSHSLEASHAMSPTLFVGSILKPQEMYDTLHSVREVLASEFCEPLSIPYETPAHPSLTLPCGYAQTKLTLSALETLIKLLSTNKEKKHASVSSFASYQHQLQHLYMTIFGYILLTAYTLSQYAHISVHCDELGILKCTNHLLYQQKVMNDSLLQIDGE